MTHEDLRRGSEVVVGSSRSFGLVFGALLALIGLLPAARGGELRLWALSLAALMLSLAFFAPGVLQPLNLAWSRLGLLLNRIVSPVVMAVVFYGAITPIALLSRRSGKSSLNLRREPAAKSYWIARNPPGPAPDTLKNQF
jgi:hypothetical protein